MRGLGRAADNGFNSPFIHIFYYIRPLRINRLPLNLPQIFVNSMDI